MAAPELPAADSYPTITAAAVQAPSSFLDRRAGIEQTCRLVEEAAAAGADLVVFPESFVPGHPLWLHFLSTNDRRSVAAYERLFANALTVPGPEVDAVAETARRCEVTVVLGVTEKRPGSSGTLYNSQLFLGRDGRLLGKHQKLVPTVREKVVHAPGGGEGIDTFETEFGRIGGLICGENSNPLATYALQALGEAVHAASWPPFMGFSSAAEVVGFVSRSVAYSGHVFVVNAVGLVGDDFFELMGDEIADPDEVRRRSGGSSIVDPHGRVLAGPLGPGEEGMLLAELDLGIAVRAKLSHDFTGHYNRFDVFELRLNRRARPPLVVDDGET
ncbi:MAG TPA: carbon-nitrogen hydrolase family protein [Gaiellaceae bacterium]|nr:carbon-nitrogen hydrolase family protein [Gaiellaceae bacterium]